MIEDPSRVLPGRVEIEGLRVLESCSFTWIFDGATHRFRRVPRDATVRLEVPAPWAGYHELTIDETAACFVVQLDRPGTRLRAWLHADPCPRCRGDQHALGDLQALVECWKERLGVRDARFLPPEPGRQPWRPFGGRAQAQGGEHHG